ncbi:DUF1491 family protein [Pikeienuella piscinae]|uniref:DUF1491 family protein n=1 Tax=Pikeienuella piscinae TaxID=2748098 RepID=A0A7M3T667_9RHOB|nr:DUF1491 family protein [Pikeienuella piscinae]QIE57498.1 DUF1491 family protein [Pikeienuella piscinae]
MKPRLTAEFWVAAYLARLERAAIPAYLAAKGDPTAGAVIVKVATMDGRASAFTRAYGPEGDRVWTPLAEAAPEPDVDAVLARQRNFDPDLWIVEIEDPKGRTLLAEEGLD